MNRLICVQAGLGRQSLPDFTNVSLGDLDSVVNYSVDHLCFYDIEILNAQDAEKVVHSLLNKIRPAGILTIGFTNTKKICRDYYMNSLDDATYIKYHTDHRSVFSENKIIQLLEQDKNMKIVKLEYTPDQLEIRITAQRVTI